MARKRTGRSEEFVLAVKEHLALHGDTDDWSALTAKFDDLPKSSHYRLINAAREEIETRVARTDSGAALRLAQQRIRARLDTPEAVGRKLKHVLPAAPSPAVLATLTGDEAGKMFDFLGYFHTIANDVQMLRSKAVRTNPEGEEVLVNAVLMDRAIGKKLQVLEAYHGTMARLFDLQKIQELYAVVLEEVGKADRGVQNEILARLRALNNERGMNVSAKIDS